VERSTSRQGAPTFKRPKKFEYAFLPQGNLGRVFLQGFETFVKSNVTRPVSLFCEQHPFEARRDRIKLMEMIAFLC
jgi:hypothetical protein